MKRQYSFIVLFFFIIIYSAPAQNRRLDSLLKATQTERIDSTKAKNYYKIASAYLNKGLVDSCSVYARKCITLSKRIKFLRGIATSYNYLGQIHSFTGFPDSAIYYFTESMNLYYQINDTNRAAGLLNNLGIVYMGQGNVSKALDYYFLGLKIKEQRRDSDGIANAYHNIAQLYADAKDPANGLKYHKLALEIRRKINDESGVGSSLIAIGMDYKKNKKPELAIETITEALRIAEKLGEEESIAIASYNLGDVYYGQGDLEKSEPLFNRSLELSRKNKNAKGIAVSLQSLGYVRMKMNAPKAAIPLFEEAYFLSKEIDEQEVLAGVSENLSEAYEKTGDHKKALMYLKIANTIQDSLYNEENIRKLTSEGLKYEHEKEKLLAEKELEKKEALARAESFRKNLIIGASILVLILVSFFSYKLSKRLQENKKQKLIIEEQQKEMIASINYAKRIQFALLAHQDLLKKNLPEHFILFNPKDIVSGDFYWATLKNNYFYMAVCDCTGHGVPGAFMSLLNINFLNEAINEKEITEPGKILDHVRTQLIAKLDGGRDGMDAVLIRMPVNRTDSFNIEYAAANNSLLLVRNNQTLDLEKDSMPIGLGEKKEPFTTHSFTINKGDNLYLYTDGFADQFGGPKGKKLKYKQLDEELLANSQRSAADQKQKLESLFTNWRGKLEQVDDVCVVGINF